MHASSLLSLRSLPRAVALAVVAAGALALGASDPASAHHNPGHGGGPGGGGDDPPPPLDGGWIYYYGLVNGEREIYRSSPDGATNGIVAGAPGDYGCPTSGCGGAVGHASHDTHDGDRRYAVESFFDGPDSAFSNAGNGMHSVDIDIVREGQATGLTVLDGSASCIHVWQGPFFVGDSTGADKAITWSGGQWLDNDAHPDCETLDRAGIFRAQLIYTGGAIAGIQTPVLSVETPAESGNLPDVNGFFDWAPDGSAVAYTRENGPDPGGLYVATPGSPPSAHTRIVEGTLFDVSWSPDQDGGSAGLQTTIAYTGWTIKGKLKGGTWGVQPDGSGRTLLAEAKQGKNSSQSSHVHWRPVWSPAGSHLAYTDYESGGPVGSEGVKQLRRMAADGSGNAVVQEEPTVPNINRPLAWTNPD